MTTRRGFLSLLVAAPFAAPAIAKAAVAEQYATGGFVRGVGRLRRVGGMAGAGCGSGGPIQRLELSMNTTSLRRELDAMVQVAQAALPLCACPDDDPHDLFLLPTSEAQILVDIP